MDSNVISTREYVLNIGLTNKKEVYNNEEGVKKMLKQSNGISPRNTRNHKKDLKNKSCIFETKKYSGNLILLSFSLSWVDLTSYHSYLKNNVSSFFKYTVGSGNDANVYYIATFFDFLIYGVLLSILGISIISGIIYYRKKVKKYEVKFRKM
ncbi:hypothetical protein MKS88_002197 [Plasmodium brasilianum]|uniref:Uncharacterized protein n=1 Tax=Plasmodium brasilianum TaxID=5824 RepID=A0ACB9YDQ7_PLABR|nr:hypothetical protein MKS88_002197 [Plasmodium brasilianum]